MADDAFQSEKERILDSIKLSASEIQDVERKTVGQWLSPTYREMRKMRVTASQADVICKRRSTTKCGRLVKYLLNPTNVVTAAMRYGQVNERAAKLYYQQKHPGNVVRDCGLFVDLESPNFAATPDGVVGNDGIMEVKCLYSAHENGLTLEQAIIQGKSPLEKVNGNIQLKRNHNYYYQVQTQLNITKKSFCEFVVYINDNEDLFVERIYRDEEFWKNILPKLNKFYYDCFLPRLVDPARGCSLDIHND